MVDRADRSSATSSSPLFFVSASSFSSSSLPRSSRLLIHESAVKIERRVEEKGNKTSKGISFLVFFPSSPLCRYDVVNRSEFYGIVLLVFALLSLSPLVSSSASRQLFLLAVVFSIVLTDQRGLTTSMRFAAPLSSGPYSFLELPIVSCFLLLFLRHLSLSLVLSISVPRIAIYNPLAKFHSCHLLSTPLQPPLEAR